ncbi:hypothetical protein FUT69_03655 [Xylella taiwanensis]|uniref:Uncharacterized protein n=1 Tax=Xylella taiwanensis TaxID=1444770 RepID=Z9JJW5_9GAMM|nr:hypothetical protein [Xylella taiwanensis]AXI84387.1 hypothetical protein AB672_10820 [Xylella taiwanensis]EWS78116.1 hypothetical protein AF72_07060 [Xylella taiwanensis]MCD8457511.1 hypothetical protein [Xylella taiwanensis]MCD8457670.1 hypothetical protein [Xylella taiwanensis]MCD8461205.1 hypothetical protein [Xylella taiwanensis]
MNHEFQNVEEAYQTIGEDLIAFAGERAWDEVVGKYEVYSKLVSSECWLLKDGCVDKKNIGDSDGFSTRSYFAVLYLRDDLIKCTGHRIWGLTFTVYPTGKINIDYDYNRPEDYEDYDDYEECEDIITVDEVKKSLRNLFG